MQSKSNLSLRQLEYFKTISDIGSFRGAAERLGVTQPTLTHRANCHLRGVFGCEAF